MSKQVGDRQAMFKKGKDGKPRQAMKNRRHDNTLVLNSGKHGAWTPHDLRRTGATLMQSLGVSLEIIDRCQNHVLPGSKVRRHYLHHDYADEKRDAWRLLGERLSLIMASE
jgi:integrase